MAFPRSENHKKNSHCPSLWYSSHLPNCWDISTTGPAPCLKSPVYFQVFIFWKAAERLRVHLCKALLRVSTARLVQQALRAHRSKGTVQGRGCCRSWGSCRDIWWCSTFSQTDALQCTTFITVTFPLSGTAISPQQKLQAQTFQLKAGSWI